MSLLRYFKKAIEAASSLPNASNATPGSSARVEISDSPPESSAQFTSRENECLEQQTQIFDENLDLSKLPSDPGKRPRIADYHPNVRERVRRQYLLNGPCQPTLKSFPQREIDGKMRRFNRSWFNEFPWLEYSIHKDAGFCHYCYLFKIDNGEQAGGDTFVGTGYRNWKIKEQLRIHQGISHRLAHERCKDLLNHKQHIEPVIVKVTEDAKVEYKRRLEASVNVVRLLLKQGLAFRGHDESDKSNNQGNFLEVLKFLADHNEDVRRVTLKNAPRNLQLTSNSIQKDIVQACAQETTKIIIEELRATNGYFSVLLDDSRDVSTKEQMAVVLRFVDKKGCVVERILGFKHVKSTCSITLKASLEELLNSHGLSISMLRGQGYDGASNMRGEFNGLKARILEVNKTTYYVHCFAHQLQLALVAVAKDHIRICELFVLVTNVVNVVGGSCKRRDVLRENQASRIVEALENEEIASGRGLNQERTLIRPADTRWSSHYGTILNMINLFDSIIDVLRTIVKDGASSNQRGEASRLLKDMLCFDFAFDLDLMKSIRGITNDLCMALQRKDQDIVNANQVNVSKQRLQGMRDGGFTDLLNVVSLFCVKHNIDVPDMDDTYVSGKRPKRKAQEMTNSHCYRVEVFTTVLDLQLVELEGHFDEVNTELLQCVSCLNPANSFEAFNVGKLVQFAKFYPSDFEEVELLVLPDQLENFKVDMKIYSDTSSLKGIGDVAQQMVEIRRNITYPLVYRLITLALVLPVATATVERAFSAMNIVKNRLRNRMGDEWMNDNLVVYLEKDIFSRVTNEVVIDRFQKMANRRGQL